MVLRDSDPEEIGGYPIEDRLGSGGMGVVYLGRSASGRRLALKVVHGQYADDQEFRIRFRREVAAARQVSGAFTAPVVDADADAPSPWMATVYIPGEDLGTHVRREGPLPLDRLQELAAGLTEALRDIHRVGVVHRDLKPANVMLAEDGPRVIDFGVSRAAEALGADALTQTGRVMGTPPYMSPEQLTTPRDVGPASDVFSLGAVLAYAATGRGPFDSDSPYETATRVVQGTPELDDVPAPLRRFVEWCLDKDPEARPTPDELLALLKGEPIPPRTTGAPAAGEKPSEATGAPAPRRRRRLLLTAAVGGLLLALAGTAAVVRLGGDDGQVASQLPAGWRDWTTKDTLTAAKGEDPSPSGPFTRCAAARAGLICAGDDVKAVRFSLATGKREWGLPVDSVPDDSSSMEGDVIGTAGDRVYVYRNDQSVPEEDSGTTYEKYAIEAVDARTGDVLWTAPTQSGTGAMAPDLTPDTGTAAATKDGVLTIHGALGDSYALLDPRDGDPRWERPLPDGECRLRAAAGEGYLLCAAGRSETRLSRLDPATGRPAWTVTVRGTFNLLGAAGDRLVLADTSGTTHRSVVTVTANGSHTRRTVALDRPQPAAAIPTLSRDTLYFTLSSGSVRAVDPRTGRQRWSRNSTVEFPGQPLASATHVYVASPSGRLAALDGRTGDVAWTRPGRGVSTSWMGDQGARLTLVGDALYVPYGTRSVYTVDVRHP
ncbi:MULTISPECIES: serine/threonine-protein kinase [Streptomyces]|uniref:Serine/threonine protein kinase n=2 Tax=Streptomyces TaxID=1883 RepID=A0A5P2BFL0_STRVZ|nr:MULTISPECIES: serine/threonine-protein kinase [Streptomyces]MYZ17092.1 PQQ-binding-like beta-propeller repeat protein [Streptomyces sp. SID337]NDZ98934.1 PQQ-binding-like beta-propeller repeat protein [Streptomyces sp. SID10116]MYY80640.1 PQQ-binding-like beta-propeller repeat protein [Streptomyces sp. SID335]NDZ89155.1 PQQ-binding-like beta-propeller repeat protein [Streptomyces sp. SID10115]NEB43944.1 PQQ-binding-like beta-propeller repeat protein [Streptomyces sp. SID339]